MSKAWMVRAGSNSVVADSFVSKGVVAVGFGSEFGETAPDLPKSALIKLYEEAYPNWKPSKVGNAASQMLRFLTAVNEGDLVVTYDSNLRRYFIGRITSGPTWDEQKVPGFPWTRKVEWERRCLRDDLSVATRNSLGSTLTLFSLNKAVQEDLLDHSVPVDADEKTKPSPTKKPSTNEEAAWETLRTEFVEKAAQFIEDRISALGWEELQSLVAGLLRALGYRTVVSPSGPDRGVDVFASPDGLGLEQPRIFVEVKHRRTTSIGAPDIRSFLGGRKTGDRCLYISTGGFSREAKYEADRADVPVTLINMPKLRELLVEHYENLDLETRALVPLDRIYWPGN